MISQTPVLLASFSWTWQVFSPFNFRLRFYSKAKISLRQLHLILEILLGQFFTCICTVPPKANVFAQTYFYAYNRKKNPIWCRSTEPKEANAMWDEGCFQLDATTTGWTQSTDEEAEKRKRKRHVLFIANSLQQLTKPQSHTNMILQNIKFILTDSCR